MTQPRRRETTNKQQKSRQQNPRGFQLASTTTTPNYSDDKLFGRNTLASILIADAFLHVYFFLSFPLFFSPFFFKQEKLLSTALGTLVSHFIKNFELRLRSSGKLNTNTASCHRTAGLYRCLFLFFVLFLPVSV